MTEGKQKRNACNRDESDKYDDEDRSDEPVPMAEGLRSLPMASIYSTDTQNFVLH